MFLQSLLMLAACTEIMVRADPAEGGRVKRSDDLPSLQGVVEGLSQQVNQLSAQLTSLQNKYKVLETRLGKCSLLLVHVLFICSYFFVISMCR